MGQTTGISWTDHTFNPWWGCTKVSSGCKHCYADTFQNRYGFDVFGFNTDGTRKALRTFGDKHWNEPLKWEADAVKAGVRRRVFCASMADVFDGHPDAALHRERLWQLIRATPHLDWQLLTKRPENVWSMVPADWGSGYSNVWLGTSVESQETVKRIELLARVPVHAVRFLSVEPLIGALDLKEARVNITFFGEPEYKPALDFVNWIIVGGESGNGARRMNPEWVDKVLADCADHPGIAVFVKQMGAVLAREMRLKHSKGEDPTEWPSKWQCQDFPQIHSLG